MAKYTVRYERDEDGCWMASIKEVTGVRTQGRSISQARNRIREALAAALGERAGAGAELVERIGGIDAKVTRHLAAVRRAQRKVEREQAHVARLARQVARQLVRVGKLSVRDAGEVMGISGARVQQLVNDY